MNKDDWQRKKESLERCVKIYTETSKEYEEQAERYQQELTEHDSMEEYTTED